MSTDSRPLTAPQSVETILENWQHTIRQIADLLERDSMDAGWVTEIQATAKDMVALAQMNPDAALYQLMQTAAGDLDHYSARHALLCALVSEMCGQWFEWSAEEIDALVCAALTMNVAMTKMQDAMARHGGALTREQRALVDAHAHASAELLTASGVSDPLWLAVVRLHHDVEAVGKGDVPPTPAQRLAQLLNRVDVYTAKLSRRAGRNPSSPALAARDACLGPAGVPDAVGATILRILGLYPPGCFVILANGDIAVVIQRGAKAHTPIVAALRRADGGMYMKPVRRDTLEESFAVARGRPSSDTSKLQRNNASVLMAS